MAHKNIYYSDKYYDDEHEYRHVILPKEIAKLVPSTHLMSESEWRGIGVQQSQGWEHYMQHGPAIYRDEMSYPTGGIFSDFWNCDIKDFFPIGKNFSLSFIVEKHILCFKRKKTTPLQTQNK